MSSRERALWARRPAHDGGLTVVPRLDHRVLRGDQADVLAGLEAVVTRVAGVAAAGEPDPAFDHGQLASAPAQAQGTAGGDAA